MRFPKLRRTLKAFINDEDGSISKKSAIGLGLVGFSMVGFQEGKSWYCSCSPQCGCVNDTGCGCVNDTGSTSGGCTTESSGSTQTCGTLLDGALNSGADTTYNPPACSCDAQDFDYSDAYVCSNLNSNSGSSTDTSYPCSPQCICDSEEVTGTCGAALSGCTCDTYIEITCSCEFNVPEIVV